MNAAKQNDFNIILGKKIREIRKAKEVSLSGLAEQMQVSYQQLQKYETGTNRISAEKLQQVANFLGVDVIDFFPNSSRADVCIEKSPIAEKFARIKNPQTKQILCEIIEKMGDV